jgi:hypothetical protein
MTMSAIGGPPRTSRQRGIRRTCGASLLALIGAAALMAAAPSVAPAATVAGEWRFDEPDGQVALDTGPHGLDGRLGSTAGSDADDPARIQGVSGRALAFDGASFVRVPDATELAPPTLTVEAVVRRTGSPGNWRYLISRGGHGCFAGSYGLYTGAAGGMAFYVLAGSHYVASATARADDVWDGAWHHVVGTFDATGLRLWIDGRPVGAPSNGPTHISYASTTMTTVFGRYVGTCDLSFSGDIDLVRLWSGALSADEVQAAAARELRPVLTTAPLPAAAPATRQDADAPSDPPAVAPGAPARACKLRLSRTRIAAGRRSAVLARVTLRGRPVRGVRVVARRRARAKPITRARTGARGRARLMILMRRAGRLRITAAVTPSCSPGYIRVTRGANGSARG